MRSQAFNRHIHQLPRQRRRLGLGMDDLLRIAIVWAVALGYAAFYFGAALETMLGDIKRYELWILAALVLIGAGLWLRRWLKGNKSVD